MTYLSVKEQDMQTQHDESAVQSQCVHSAAADTSHCDLATVPAAVRMLGGRPS